MSASADATTKRGAAELLSAIASRAGRPTTVVFQVTDRCNYDCAHCFQVHDGPAELTFDQVDQILAQLADFGVLFLTLMGGEFFVRRDADDILRAARRQGFAIKLLTTGHYVTEARADLLASLKPIQVDLSFYAASPGVHDELTRIPGSWKRTLEAAKRLIQRGIVVTLKTPVMSINAEELRGIVKLAEQIGALYAFDPLVTGKQDGDQHTTSLRADDDTVFRVYSDDELGTFHQLALRARKMTHKTRPVTDTPCRAGQEIVSITPQGMVRPCNILPIDCGDLKSQSIADIFSTSPELQRVRTLSWGDIDDCNVCELRKYCSRCHSMALLEEGKLTGPSLEACRQAVLSRDAVRERGVIPPTETAVPPPLKRLRDDRGRRPPALRVLQ